MKSILQVKEYDYITCNEKFKDNPNYNYIDKKTFYDLENFILEETNNKDLMGFFSITTKKSLGKIIVPKNYVGLIQMKNGFQIEILPKIDFNEVDTAKKVFIDMLRTLKDFPYKTFNQGSLKIEKFNLYEMFINMYINEVKYIIKKGLKSGYINIDSNETFYKGKLIVSENIRCNTINKGRFYVSYDNYTLNRFENRIIKSTLLKLKGLSKSVYNINEIRKLLNCLCDISPIDNYKKTFSLLTLNRDLKDYDNIIKWSKVFLLNESFTPFTGETIAYSLLFPMERLFESYVAETLKKLLRNVNCHIIVQDKRYYLFDDPKQFRLIPDMVIEYDNRVIILDTKWKKLKFNSSYNYGISQNDIYQMYVYGTRYQTKEVWLLYPKSYEIDDINKNTEYISGNNLSIKVFFLELDNINLSLESLIKELNIK